MYLVTVTAERRTDVLRPNIWAGLGLIFVFGFTSYAPSTVSLIMGIVAYFVIGAGFAALKWIDLVMKIKQFTKVMDPLITDTWMLRHLVYEEFKPNNSADNVMTLPPDPYEFRIRISLWFAYWPSFTILRPLAKLHRAVATFLWDVFHNLSTSVYERPDKNEG